MDWTITGSQYFNVKCGDIEECNNIKSCQKKHPKKCKRFKLNEGCRFSKECSYNHQEQKPDEIGKK